MAGSNGNIGNAAVSPPISPTLVEGKAMPKIDIENVSESTGGEYPARFRHVDAACTRQALGDAVGLSQYGVNLTRIPPGAASALRHWHEYEDEFVYVISGELMLMEEGGETLLRAGDAAGFKAGVANGVISLLTVLRATRSVSKLERAPPMSAATIRMRI